MKPGKVCERCRRSEPLDSLSLCRYCLCEVVERRFTNNVRQAFAGRKGVVPQLSIVAKPNSLQAAVATQLAARLFPPGPFSLKVKVAAIGADEAAASLMEGLMSARYSGGDSLPDVLSPITDAELAMYASIKRIKYSSVRQGGIKHALQGFQARYPGTMEALAKIKGALGRKRQAQ